jgi:hypothetical protein
MGIGRTARIAWPPRSPDLTALDRMALLGRIMNATTYIREQPEITQRIVNSCLNREKHCTENNGGYSELLTYNASHKMCQ